MNIDGVCLPRGRQGGHELGPNREKAGERQSSGPGMPQDATARWDASNNSATLARGALDDRLGGVDDPHGWFPDLSPALAGLFFLHPALGRFALPKLQRIRRAGVLVLGAMTSMTSPVRGSIRLHGDAGPCEPIIWRSRSARIRVR
jgi:hypothetical protein